MAVQRDMRQYIDYGDVNVTNGISVFDWSFDDHFAYDGDDLGITYSEQSTKFALWAPTASEANVILYERWNGPRDQIISMERTDQGVWRYEYDGDLRGKLYTFSVKIGKQWNEAADPYAKAVAVNGDRGVILDLSSTNPERWNDEKPPLHKATDAIIYEASIRDFTAHPSSGVDHPGTFVGACQAGTTTPGGFTSGMDYLKELGITHVQFLPMYDFCERSVDETRPVQGQYNWGYDPKNYNVPEGSYSTNAFDPICRIREMKQMIQTLHDNGLRVIMDVVYNHVYDIFEINFNKLVPGYYFRYHPHDRSVSNGSGCGNDTASERKMMRKFMVESVVYWVKEYHLDGFRFDLMGLHDIETMIMIRQKLDEIDPNLIILGEGWNLNTALMFDQRAVQMNAFQMPRIAHFNDRIRDALKGSVFFNGDAGFINGKPYLEREIEKGIAASIHFDLERYGFANEPVQTITYVEAHDNNTLWDKLSMTNGYHSEEVRRAMQRMSMAIILTSQGIPFLHAGMEFMRTKYGEENSYKSSIEINQMDWERRGWFDFDVQYVRELIKIRKEHPAFRMPTAKMIRQHLHFEPAPMRAVAFTLRGHANNDPSLNIYVAHNANGHEESLEIPNLGEWKSLFGDVQWIRHKHAAADDAMQHARIAPHTTVILTCDEE